MSEFDSIYKWSAQDVDEQLLNSFLKNAKNYYLNQLNNAHLDENDSTFFIWSQQSLCIYLIRVSHDYNLDTLLVFATTTSDSKDSIKYYNFLSETNNTQFIKLYWDDQLRFLLTNTNLKDYVKPNEIIENTIDGLVNFATPAKWANTFFTKEYHHAENHFEQAPIDQYDFNNVGLHSPKFKIQQIINSVNDQQFSSEFKECMDAYEHEYYYPAAAGLGGIMESLLRKTLENYKRASSRIISSDPTVSNYLGALKQFNLIDYRQTERIKAAFMLRNAISHYNQGFTEVDDIQSMLHGIENIYSTLYLPSQEWKENHPGQRLPEPNHQN